MTRKRLLPVALLALLLAAGVTGLVIRGTGVASASDQPANLSKPADPPAVEQHGVLKELPDGSLVPTADSYSVKYDEPVGPELRAQESRSPGATPPTESVTASPLTQAPSAEQSAKDYAQGRKMVKVAPVEVQKGTKEGLESYISQQKALLLKHAEANPGMLAGALVTFTEPTSIARVEEIARNYELYVEYFEWVADGGITGGSSTCVSPDIASVAAGRAVLNSEGTILGYKAALVSGTVGDLARLGAAEAPDIVLVDCGNLDEIVRQQEAGNAPIHDIPERIYDAFRTLQPSS